MKVKIITIAIGTLGTVRKSLETGLKELKIGGSIRIQNTALLRSFQNTEKSPGDLMRFTVIQTPVK